MCSGCGHVDSLARDHKRYCCKQCSLEIDADVNAAVNILMRHLAGGNAPPPVVEPEEMPALSTSGYNSG